MNDQDPTFDDVAASRAAHEILGLPQGIEWTRRMQASEVAKLLRGMAKRQWEDDAKEITKLRSLLREILETQIPDSGRYREWMAHWEERARDALGGKQQAGPLVVAAETIKGGE